MKEAGANTEPIESFLSNLDNGIDNALSICNAPKPASKFVNKTFSMLDNAPVHVVAAMFTFGREEVIPNMFRSIVNKIDRDLKGRLKSFIYYLDRHIGIDEDEHGPAALKMIKELCQKDDSKLSDAVEASKETMKARIIFWDGILEQLKEN